MINSITGKVPLRSFQLNGYKKITLGQEIKSLVDSSHGCERTMATRLIKSDLWREKWTHLNNQLAEKCINEEFFIVSSRFGFFKESLKNPNPDS